MVKRKRDNYQEINKDHHRIRVAENKKERNSSLNGIQSAKMLKFGALTPSAISGYVQNHSLLKNMRVLQSCKSNQSRSDTKIPLNFSKQGNPVVKPKNIRLPAAIPK